MNKNELTVGQHVHIHKDWGAYADRCIAAGSKADRAALIETRKSFEWEIVAVNPDGTYTLRECENCGLDEMTAKAEDLKPLGYAPCSHAWRKMREAKKELIKATTDLVLKYGGDNHTIIFNNEDERLWIIVQEDECMSSVPVESVSVIDGMLVLTDCGDGGGSQWNTWEIFDEFEMLIQLYETIYANL